MKRNFSLFVSRRLYIHLIHVSIHLSYCKMIDMAYPSVHDDADSQLPACTTLIILKLDLNIFQNLLLFQPEEKCVQSV